jgi:hypothetical protein
MHLLHNSKAVVHEAAALTARAVKAAARKRPLLWPTWQTLPVAGLDVPVAQSVLYSLRKTLAGDEEVCNACSVLMSSQCGRCSAECSDPGQTASKPICLKGGKNSHGTLHSSPYPALLAVIYWYYMQ